MTAPEFPQVHPELQEAARKSPSFTMTGGKLWLVRLAMRFMPRPRLPAEILVENRHVPGPDGRRKIRLRLYRPRAPSAPIPVLLWLHGGGYVIGRPEMDEAVCARYAQELGIAVVSVDYRLAPEAKFPAASHDCLAATRWAYENASALDADPGCLFVAGDSAGGNLAAVTALRLRDEGGPKPRGQLLIYPVTDYFEPGTPSMIENAEGYGQTRDGMIWFWNHNLADASVGVHPHASPLRENDLGGLPPALVYTAQYDPLRDEGEAYADRLAAADVPVEVKRWEGMNHGFFNLPGLVNKATAAMDEACAWVRGLAAG